MGCIFPGDAPDEVLSEEDIAVWLDAELLPPALAAQYEVKAALGGHVDQARSQVCSGSACTRWYSVVACSCSQAALDRRQARPGVGARHQCTSSRT